MDQDQKISQEREPMEWERGSLWSLVWFPVVGCLIGWVVMMMVVYVLPRKYESVAVLQINGSGLELDPFGATEGFVGADAGDGPTFFLTEVQVLTAQQTLMRVVERLDLASRWNISPDGAVTILMDAIEAEPLDGTHLVRVRVRHTNAQDARDIAEKVVDAYQERRTGMEMERAGRALDALHGELRDQSDLVEEKRKVLDTIVQVIGIFHVEGREPGAFETVPGTGYADAERELGVLEREKAQLEIDCKTLLTLKSDEILKYAPFLDAIPRELHDRRREYLTEKGVMEEMVKAGMEDGGLELIRQRALVVVLKNEMESGVTVLREAMQTRLNILARRLETERSVVADQRGRAVNKSLELHDFVEARRGYENSQAMLQAMQRQHSAQKIRLKIPRNPVTIHEKPREGRAPVTPDVDAYLMTGKLGGAAIGGALALLIAGMRRGRGRESAVVIDDDDDDEWADD